MNTINTNIELLIEKLKSTPNVKNILSVSYNSMTMEKILVKYNITNRIIISNINKLKHEKNKHISDNLDSNIFYNIDKEIDIFFNYNNYELEKIEIKSLMYLYILLLIYYSYGYVTISHKQYIANSFNKLYKFYYRGVSNESFDLIPSMYRNIKEKHIIINNDYINKKYLENNFIFKYEKVFGKIDNYDDFYEYMQHSCSFSPLLDFTTDIDIAKVFATNYYGDINSYRKDNAAIYLFQNDIEITKSAIREIEIYNGKLTINSTIFGKPLCLCTLDDFKIEYNILSNESNDRMKYQKGVFIDFRKAVIVNNHLCCSNNLRFVKVIIGEKDKEEIYNSIVNRKPEYKYEYLMDPYSIFNKIAI